MTITIDTKKIKKTKQFLNKISKYLAIDCLKALIFVYAYFLYTQHNTLQAQYNEIDRIESSIVVSKKVARDVQVFDKIGEVTAYSCGNLKTQSQILMNCPSLLDGEPTTSSGTTPIPGKTMACDKANMGRKFEIDGIGILDCTDTGGAIAGPGRFDIYLETYEEAIEFGRQTLRYREIK